jgi:hypothetical protein
LMVKMLSARGAQRSRSPKGSMLHHDRGVDIVGSRGLNYANLAQLYVRCEQKERFETRPTPYDRVP